jgi:hypothetical protein
LVRNPSKVGEFEMCEKALIFYGDLVVGAQGLEPWTR